MEGEAGDSTIKGFLRILVAVTREWLLPNLLFSIPAGAEKLVANALHQEMVSNESWWGRPV